MNRFVPAWLAVALVLLCCPSAWADDFERAFVVELAGEPAGSMRMWSRQSEGRITSGSEMSLRIKRGTFEVAIEMMGEFVETTDHRPVSMRSEQRMGAIPVITETVFGEREMRITTIQGDQRSERTAPMPDEAWLTPRAAEKVFRERVSFEHPPSEVVGLRVMEPTSGPVLMTLTRDRFAREQIEVGGKQVEVLASVSASSLIPGVETREWLDAGLLPVRLEMLMGGIPIRVTMSDAPAGPVAKAPELMIATVVKPDRIIQGARSSRRATFVLSVEGGALAEPPSAGAQVTEAVSGGGVRVRVESGRTSPATPDEAADAGLLASSTFITSEDPKVFALARAAAGDIADPNAKAEALRRAVHGHITKRGYDVGFATAAEVCRTRAGDCTEHAVLLAALLRAEGIPARIVTGLIYADQFEGAEHVFGYHMWTQALVPGEGGPRWLDLDATLPVELAFDATHIALQTSALADDTALQAHAAVATVLGRLNIRVESVE